MNVINRATTDKRVQPLLSAVRSKVEIVFHRSVPHEPWGSKLEGGKAHILFTDCKYPSAALAHELLHVETQLLGYKKMRVISSSMDPQGEDASRLLFAL